MILRRTRRGARINGAQGLHQELGAHIHQAVKQLAGGFKLADGGLLFKDDIPGVHVMGQVHGGHTRRLIAVEHGPLDRRRATVFRQQGAMDIDRAESRHRQDLIRQNPSIGDDDQNIGLQRLNLPEGRSVAHLLRLVYRQARL